MRLSGWLQLAALGLALLIAARVLGTYIARVYSDRPLPEDRVFAPLERPIDPLTGVDSRSEQRWTAYARSVLAFSAVSVLGLYALQRVQGPLPLEPDRRRGGPPRARVQHGGQLRHEHELADVRRRVDDEPPHADGRARRCRTSCRPRPAWPWRSPHPRARPAAQRRRSATSGSTSRARPLASCCRSSFVLALVLVEPGRRPEPRTASTRVAHARGRRRSRSPGARSPARRRSRSRHERRRVLQRELGAPVREPDAVHEPPRDLRCSCSSRSRWPTRSGGWSGTTPGLACSPRCRALARVSLVAMTSRSHGNPPSRRSATRRGAGGEHGGQGIALRRGRVRALRGSTTGTSTGAVELHARQLHAARRRRPAVNIMLGEVSPGGVGAGLYGMLCSRSSPCSSPA